jgi:hypothetical protein
MLGLKWNSKSRLLIHLADAPCHGTRFTDGADYDKYPDGDPNGLMTEELMKQLRDAKIDYYFVRITSLTDKMINIFKSLYDDPASKRSLHVINLGDNVTALMPTVINCVTTSVTRYDK